MKLKKFKYKKVKSTNDTAIKLIKSKNFKSGIVITETQSKGKGRYGRNWISYKGNLFATIFHEFNLSNLSISRITKINCLLVKKLLLRYTKKKITFKKPNDLLIEKKKNQWDSSRNNIIFKKKVFNNRYRYKFDKKSNY